MQADNQAHKTSISSKYKIKIFKQIHINILPSCRMKLVGFPGDVLSRATYKKRSPCWAHDQKDPQKQWVAYHCLEVSSLSTCPLLSRVLLQSPCTRGIFSKDWESSVMSLEKASYSWTLHVGKISKTLKSIWKKREVKAAPGCSLFSVFKNQRSETENVCPGTRKTHRNQVNISLHRSKCKELECTGNCP